MMHWTLVPHIAVMLHDPQRAIAESRIIKLDGSCALEIWYCTSVYLTSETRDLYLYRPAAARTASQMSGFKSSQKRP